jgi:pimeloyl-ACP methyl ester carboxylesterase
MVHFYTTWSRDHLEPRRFRTTYQTTTVWMTEPSPKPLIVMVHGISGDYTGLVPLAEAMSETHSVVIVELPGHGKSGMVSRPNATKLQAWFQEILSEIEKDHGPATMVIAHSFGCSVVLDQHVLRTKRVILLNPVPTPSDMYARYARLVVKSSHFLAHVYNFQLFVGMRSRVLTKVNDAAARKRVQWVGVQSRPSSRQIVYQAKLVDMILDKTVYERIPKDAVHLVMCAMSDTTPSQQDTLDMKAVFGNKTNVVYINGGHLAPIESPLRVAAIINEHMVY